MTETLSIPLNKLVPWDGNVRKTGAGDGIDELAASILAHGLLQPLVARKGKRGKHAVVAGRRRFLALSTLADNGSIEPDYPVDCRIVDAAADPAELSLAENVVRMPMHPADQFEAFSDLLDRGNSPAVIAERFGISEATVARRLKLGRVAPEILDAYRAGDLGLEQVQAFAVSDDHTAQRTVWRGLTGYRNSPGVIRASLTEGEIPATDKRVLFVGLDAYEAAGGAVRRDLFDTRNSGYVQDPALLDRLVQDRLDADAGSIRAEGWAWVSVTPEFGYEDRSAFRRRQPDPVPLTEAEQAELDRLAGEYDALAAEIEDDDDPHPDTSAHFDAVCERMDALNDCALAWSDDVKAIAGAVVTLARDGTVDIERGLVRPGDAPKAAAREPENDSSADPSPALPAALIADLTAQKTAALQAELAQRPDTALAAVTHALALRAFYGCGGDSCLKIDATIRSLQGQLVQPDACQGLVAFEAGRDAWSDRLPGDPGDLWAWCLEQPQDVLLQLLAVAASSTIDAVQKAAHPDAGPLLHAEALGRAVSLRMAGWFTPTAANFFSRVTRAAILEALAEAKGVHPAPGWLKLKKAELAALAEREIANTGWLPQPLRPCTGHGTGDAAEGDIPADQAA